MYVVDEIIYGVAKGLQWQFDAKDPVDTRELIPQTTYAAKTACGFSA